MKSVGTETMKSAILHIFRLATEFWVQHHQHAFKDTFPVLKLLELLSDTKTLSEYGPLNRGLVIQDLATSGIITSTCLMEAMKAGVVNGKDLFALLGEGGKEGLELILKPENRLNMTANQQLLQLYNVHRPHLGITRDDEATWDNISTIEHIACKFYRFVKFCTTNVDCQREFWKIVGFDDFGDQ